MAKLAMDAPSERGFSYCARIRFTYIDLTKITLLEYDTLYDVVFAVMQGTHPATSTSRFGVGQGGGRS